MSNYKSLDAWHHSMELVKQVFTVTKHYPKEELYGITSQSRRAAVSIPSNIAEGIGRQFKKETIQFLHIARASLYELETLVNIAAMVEILNVNKFSEMIALIEKCLQLINGLIRHYEDDDSLK